MTALLAVGAVWAALACYSAGAFLLAAWRSPKGGGLWGWADLWRRRCKWTAAHLDDTPGIYVYWAGLIPWYVGQSVNLGDRIDQHGFDTRFMPCTHVTAYACPASRLDDDERNLIQAYPWTRLLKINRTKGNQ